METCKHVSKQGTGFGGTYRIYCCKPIYEDGYCHSHFKKAKAKAIPYGHREGYREPRSKELSEGRTVYLKTMGSYGGYH